MYEEILKGIQALFPNGGLVELRIPQKGTVVGYFQDHEKMASAIETYSGKVQAVYYTLNRPSAELYEKSQNKDKAVVSSCSTGDMQILSREWLLIDCDPIRVDELGKPLVDQKLSTTDAEKEKALEVCRTVNKYLQGLSWPAPISADSGNGYHLLYNLGGIESTNELTQIIKNVLVTLSQKFNTEFVKIDTSVYNPSRITKAYGSMACKGEDTPDRPHRLSRIRMVGGTEPVTVAQLLAIKSPAPKPASTIIKAFAKDRFATMESLPEKIEEMLDFYKVDHRARKEEQSAMGVTDKGRTYKWVLVHCPFNEAHDHGEVAVFLHEHDGHYGFKCFHESCAANDWHAFRARLESISGAKFYFTSNLKGAVSETAETTSVVKLERASGIKPEVLNWLWTNRVPFGKLTLFAGHPGIGKGMATMYVAAKASTGTGWHDCPNTNAPMEVVVISSEDAAGDTLVPRLMAAGANMDKVYIVNTINTSKGDKGFTLDTDLPALRKTLEQNPDIKVVIIDPIMNHLGALKGNVEQEVRAAFTPLGKLAEKFGVAVILVTHFNKSNGTDSIQRVGGAMGMVGAVRVAWSFAEDKEDGDRKMEVLKANVSKDDGGLVYKIVSEDVLIDGHNVSVGKIAWGHKTHTQVGNTLDSKFKNMPQTAIKTAMVWLEEFLADGEAYAVEDVLKAAKSQDIKEHIARNAYDKLGGVPPFHQDSDPNKFFWALPKEEHA